MADEKLGRDGVLAVRKPYATPRVIFSELRVKENTAVTTKLRGPFAVETHTTSTLATS